MGFAPLKGEIYTGDNKGDYVTISSNDLTSSVIANVAIHELGHFFGLGHTSDDEYGYEYDPFDDTPECDSTDFYHNCPDYGYIMFPTEDYHYSHSKFTTQQMEIIRYYLYSHAHK